MDSGDELWAEELRPTPPAGSGGDGLWAEELRPTLPAGSGEWEWRWDRVIAGTGVAGAILIDCYRELRSLPGYKKNV